MEEQVFEMKATARESGRQELMTTNEAADYLKVSTRHLWTITDKGMVASIKVGRCVRYAVEDLDAYIEWCRRPSIRLTQDN